MTLGLWQKFKTRWWNPALILVSHPPTERPAIGSVYSTVAAVIALSLFALPLPHSPMQAGVESWALALFRAHDLGLAFGRDIVWTGGPAGWLAVPDFNPEHFWLRLTVDLTFTLVVCAGVVLVVCRISAATRWAAVLLFAIMSATQIHAGAPEFLMMSGVLCWGLLAFDHGGHYLFIALAFMAWCAFVKVGFLFTGTVACAALCWRWRTWLPAIMWVGYLVVEWVLLGQPLTALPAWCGYSFSVVRGYDSCMVMDTSPLIFWTAAITVMLAIATVVVTVSGWAKKLWLVWTIFAAWKIGIVRPDMLHQGVLLGFVPFLLFVVPTGPPVVFGLCICLMAWQGQFGDRTIMATAHAAENLRTLAQLSSYRATGTNLNVQAKAQVTLPLLLSLAGTNTVDVFSWDCGVAVLGGFNYRPRPMPQSYGAYTAALERLNQRHYQQHPPAFVLLNIAPVDNHFAAAEDGLVLADLIFNYAPAGAEKGWLLLKRKPNPVRLELHRINRSRVLANHTRPIAGDKPLWVSARCTGNHWRRFFYADRLVTVKIRQGNRTVECKSPRECMAVGFVVCPLVLGSGDMLNRNTTPLEISFSEDAQFELSEIKQL